MENKWVHICPKIAWVLTMISGYKMCHFCGAKNTGEIASNQDTILILYGLSKNAPKKGKF